LKRIITFVATVSVLWACNKDRTPLNPCPDVISYVNDIKPMIDASCATTGCHDATGAGGLVFMTHGSVSANAIQMLSAIKHESGVTPMPFLEAQWQQEDITKFTCWLEQGALNN
jgi:hypothetical protein